VNTLSVADRPSGLAISDDGRTLYVTHLLTGQISVISLRLRPPHPLQHLQPRSHIPAQGASTTGAAC
jgi:sugar lactone lactonase YvrE